MISHAANKNKSVLSCLCCYKVDGNKEEAGNQGKQMKKEKGGKVEVFMLLCFRK